MPYRVPWPEHEWAYRYKDALGVTVLRAGSEAYVRELAANWRIRGAEIVRRPVVHWEVVLDA